MNDIAAIVGESGCCAAKAIDNVEGEPPKMAWSYSRKEMES